MVTVFSSEDGFCVDFLIHTSRLAMVKFEAKISTKNSLHNSSLKGETELQE